MDYIEIGKFKKTHGLKGELRGSIDELFWNDVGNVEAFFVKIRGEYLPYFIESIRGNENLILKFEEIDSKEDASLFTNKRIYLRKDEVTVSEEEIFAGGLEFGFLKGYTLVEKEVGEVGEILRVDEFPQQEMATVSYKGKEVLIPMIESWVDSIDQEVKKIQMSLPDGLLDVF